MELYYSLVGTGTTDPFKALRAPMRAGRSFDERDLGTNLTAVVVNDTLARRCWPGENAVGKTIQGTNKKRILYVLNGLIWKISQLLISAQK